MNKCDCRLYCYIDCTLNWVIGINYLYDSQYDSSRYDMGMEKKNLYRSFHHKDYNTIHGGT